MVKFKQPNTGMPQATPGLRRGEKIKLGLMAGGVLILGGAFLYSLQVGRAKRAESSGDLPRDMDAQAPQEIVYTPDVDRDALAALVRDAEGADRVMLELEAVEALIPAARRMTAHSYRIGEEDGSVTALDATSIATITSDPGAVRGDPYFARGWIDTIEERRTGPASETRYLGRLILEDESHAYFLALDKPDNVIFGDFVRMDGLLLKVFSDEDAEESGKWLEGPLLVGRGLQRSYASFGEVTELDGRVLAGVIDDNAETGITGLPFLQLWHLMAYARDRDLSAINWDDVALLDGTALSDVLTYGDEFRYQPFRIPVSQLQSITIKQAGENPARLARFTEGWIGNTTWPNVIHYVAPMEFDRAKLTELVTARGFFFKNYAYEPRDGGINVAPVFVLTGIERFEQPSNEALTYMTYLLAGSAVGLLIFLSLLLTRDKRSAQALQNRLVHRRRSRRGATA